MLLPNSGLLEICILEPNKTNWLSKVMNTCNLEQKDWELQVLPIVKSKPSYLVAPVRCLKDNARYWCFKMLLQF